MQRFIQCRAAAGVANEAARSVERICRKLRPEPDRVHSARLNSWSMPGSPCP